MGQDASNKANQSPASYESSSSISRTTVTDVTHSATAKLALMGSLSTPTPTHGISLPTTPGTAAISKTNIISGDITLMLPQMVLLSPGSPP